MMLKIKSGVIALSLFTLALLGGCGGGGGSSGGSSSSTLGGTAAVGYPIVGGTVNVVCAAGDPVTGTTTDNAGDWSVTLNGQTLPCAVQVSGGTINGGANTTPYHSIAVATGTVNVTPLTDLLVANLMGATPDTWFTGLGTAPAPLAAIGQTQVDAALGQLRAALALTPLNTLDPVTLAFNATPGVVMDDILSALQSTMTSTGTSHGTLLGNAAVAMFTPPAGFDTALATAYAGTTSGNPGGGMTCDTTQYVADAVRAPTTNELASYAATYTGSEGTYGPNPGDPFVPSGSATLVFATNGSATYNSGALTVTSICLDKASSVLYVMAGVMTHFDLFSNGDLYGVAPNGNVVDPAAYTGGGGTIAVISGISPSTGSEGTAVYINGSNLNSFTPSPTVMFGSIPAAVTSYSYLGGVQITVNVPAGLSAGNHTITVSNSDGSGSVSAGVFNVVAAAPFPVGLTPTVLAFNQISLTWTPTANSTYKIYRSASPNFTPSPANLVNSYSGNSILLGALGPGPFVDNNLSAATTYYYKITEIPWGVNSESLPSAEVSATTNALSGIVGVDWINNPIGTGAAITSVAWSGTNYVAVDMIGKAHVSTDAITWTSYNTGVTLPLTAITWSGTQFVAVGNLGSVVTSPDGINWTVRTSGSNSYLYDVTWSGTQFVAVGSNSTVLTSPDGINWTLRNSGLQVIALLNSVTWSGNKFVVVGSGGHIIASTDGVFWGTESSYTTNNLQSVVWNGSKFVVVGAGGLVYSSSGNAYWSQAAIGNSSTLNSLIWTGQQLIAAGNNGVVLRSPDGITWTPAASGTVEQLNAITGSGNTYVIVGGAVVLKSL